MPAPRGSHKSASRDPSAAGGPPLQSTAESSEKAPAEGFSSHRWESGRQAALASRASQSSAANILVSILPASIRWSVPLGPANFPAAPDCLRSPPLFRLALSQLNLLRPTYSPLA